jgi:uncharacterized integral membrane protein
VKIYLKTVLWLVFIIANILAVETAFAAMTYKSDLTFYLGASGLVLLLVTDCLIVKRLFRNRTALEDVSEK